MVLGARPSVSGADDILGSMAAAGRENRARSRMLPLISQRNVAIGRIGAGAVYVAFPRVLTQPWTGIADRRVDALGRAIGVRDLALGVGAVVALSKGASARGWFEAAILADAVDAVATLLVFRDLPTRSRWGILAAAITSVVASARVATEAQQV